MLPLLAALRLVVDRGVDDPAPVDVVGADRAAALLPRPLGGLDATEVRALARTLRAREKPARRRTRDLVARAARPARRRAARRAGRRAGAARRAASAACSPRAAVPSSTTARRPRRCSGRSGTGTDWRAGCARVATRGAASGPAGPPRPRRHLRALRGGRPGRGAARAHQRARVPGDAAGPADPRRHARRARGARRGRPAAHRPPRQGPGVAARRGRPRPGGGVARPAPPARCSRRPDRRRRAAAAGDPRGVLAEERRLFYVACTRARRGCGDRGRVARRRRRAAVPVRRTSSAAEPRAPRRHDSGRRARCRWPGWSPSCAVRSPTPAQPEPLRRAAARRLARLAAEGVATGRPVAPAADPATWWGTRALTAPRPAGRGPPTSRSRCPPAPWRGPDLPGQVVPRARGRRERRQRVSQGFGKRRPRDRRAGRRAASRRPTRDESTT